MRATLFVTCLGDQFFADACADSIELLRSLGVEVDVARGQTCCGQPAYNAGRWPEARSMAGRTLEVLADAEYVVVLSGSCTAMIRRGYEDLYGGGAAVVPGAADLAGRTFELAEFIVGVLGVEDVGPGLAGRTVAYHHGCHALRELGVREQPLTLLENAGAELVQWEAAEECCGFGGLFSAKLPEVSAAMADRKLDTLPDPDIVTSADPGCLLHLSGRAAQRGDGPVFRHVASVLWEAANGSS